MKQGKKSRSVLDRVESALALQRVNTPGVAPSISALARQAGVSRANLYSSHPQLLAKLRNTTLKKELVDRKTTDEQLSRLKDENKKLQRINKAVLLLNIELRLEIVRLNRRLAGQQRRSDASSK